MAVKTRVIFASVTATANDAAHIDIPRSGIIRGIEWTAHTAGGAPVTGEYVSVEVAFNPSGQATTNDVLGRISQFDVQGFLTTSGAGYVAPGKFSGPTAISLRSGDRLYLNVLAESGSSTWRITCILHIDE